MMIKMSQILMINTRKKKKKKSKYEEYLIVLFNKFYNF